MKKSFYHYMMKHRDVVERNDMTRLANTMYEDQGFPKHSKDYHEISTYLELSALLESMMLFDEAWDNYIQEV